MAKNKSKSPDPAECLVYSLEEAGRLLGLGRSATYNAAANGDIPTVRIGKLFKVPKAALQKVLDKATADTRAA